MMRTPRSIKWACLFFFLGSLGFYAIGIKHPARLYWDETLHVNGARTILYGQRPYSAPFHPPFGREILVASLFLFGDSPGGSRGLSVIAGAGTITLVLLTAFELTHSVFFSALSSLLLLCDPMFYLHSRMGMLDIFVTFFMVLSFWVFLKIYFCHRERNAMERGDLPSEPGGLPRREARPETGRRAPRSDRQLISLYYLLGVTLGLAFAVKALAAVLYPIFFIPLGYSILRGGDSRRKWKGFINLILGFLIPTLLIFWIPYRLIGYSFEDIHEHLVWMWNFMHSFKGYEGVLSRWYEWLLVKQPIWYAQYPVDPKHLLAIVATGNYLFWFGAEIAFLILLIAWRKVPKEVFFIHLIIAAQFAFWSIKPATHIYYMLPILPFYALLLGTFFKFLLDRFPKKGRYIKIDAVIYLVCCFFVFGYYFPLLYGVPLDKDQIHQYLFPGTSGPGANSRTSVLDEKP